MATAKKTITKTKTSAKKAAVRVKKAPEVTASKGHSSAEATERREAVIYTMTGSKAGTIALPSELFGAKWNADLVHQVVVGMQANARPTVAHTKFRGEVSGGGKKPWKQKGTGRARHGSIRSPIWKGGGVTHGPRAERDYSVKINRKMRAGALAALLTRKCKDGEVIFVDTFSFATPKTKEAKAALVAIAKGAGVPALATKRAHAAVIALATKNTNTEKSLRNIGSLETVEVRNLNPVDLVTNKYLVIESPVESVATLSARLTK
ncbi:50S ribosomal protein L4 [Candidatus Parcubacteria bacterium]|nr:50S ribosomal protein L4 [Candidatus Parcubacteria bacterium]